MKIVYDMPNEEYHKHPAVSRSGLMEFLRSPQHYYHKYLSGNAEKEETQALTIGSAFHTLLLEPDKFSSQYFVWSGAPRNTKAGKDEYQEATDEACGKRLLKRADFEEMQRMAKAIKDQPAARRLLNMKGKAEVSFFWTDEETSAEVKARPDFWITDGIILDLKTTADASPNEFQKSIVNYGYDIQAFMIMEGAKACGLDVQSFVFLPVEKEQPYACAVYTADNDLLRCGEYRYKTLLRKYAQCDKANKWPGYGDLIQPIGPPEWFVNRLDKEATEGVLAK